MTEFKESVKEIIADQGKKKAKKLKKSYIPYHYRSKIFNPNRLTKTSNYQNYDTAFRT